MNSAFRPLRFLPALFLAAALAPSAAAMNLASVNAPHYAFAPVTVSVANVSAPGEVWSETDALGWTYLTGREGVHRLIVTLDDQANGQRIEAREFSGDATTLTFNARLAPGTYVVSVVAEANRWVADHNYEVTYYNENGDWESTGIVYGGADSWSDGVCDSGGIAITVVAGGATPQTITWIAVPPANWPWNRLGPVTLSAISSSGQPVSFSVETSAPYSWMFAVSGSQVSYCGSASPVLGWSPSFTLRAAAPGNATYDYAEISVPVTMTMAPQTISLKVPNHVNTGGVVFLNYYLSGNYGTVPVFSGGGLSGDSIQGSNYYFPANAAGTASISVSCPGNNLYLPTFSYVNCRFEVGPATAPTIVNQPAGQNIVSGETILLQMNATGIPSPTAFQWLKNGTPVAAGTATVQLQGDGLTRAELRLANAQASDSGSYTVVVSNGTGSVTSAVASVTVGAAPPDSAPAITQQPTAASASLGGTVTLSVVATGWPRPTYQWRLGTVALPGATSASFTLSNLPLSLAGSYNVVVSNSVNSITSSSAAVAVKPTLTAGSDSATIVVGSTATLVAPVVGAPEPTYVWKQDGVVVTGATTATLTIPNATLSHAGAYSFTATNSGGSTSGGMTLSVLATPNPVIVAQPVAAPNAVVGGGISLSVSAIGMPTLTYQWKKNNVPIPDGPNNYGVRTPTLQLINLQSGDSDYYTVEVTNSYGSVTSSVSFLMVFASESGPTITAQPVSQTVGLGASVTFAVTAEGIPSLGYQWHKDGTAITGATNPSLSVQVTSAGDGGTYGVTVNNGFRSVAASATLTVQLSAATAYSLRRAMYNLRGFASPATAYLVRADGDPPVTPPEDDNPEVDDIWESTSHIYQLLTGIPEIKVPWNRPHVLTDPLDTDRIFINEGGPNAEGAGWGPLVLGKNGDAGARASMTIGAGTGANSRQWGRQKDIIAHELAHGVTAETALDGLVYLGDAAILHEALADFWAAAHSAAVVGLSYNPANWTVAPTWDDQVWMMGEQLPGGALRCIYDPQSLSSPYTGKDFYVTVEAGAHANSTVISLALKLLVTGGQHPRAAQYSRYATVPSLGWENMVKIVGGATSQMLNGESLQQFRNHMAINAELVVGKKAATAVHLAFDLTNVPNAGNNVRPANISTRGGLFAGESLISGISLAGSGPNKTFLLRGIGPALATLFQVSGASPDTNLILLQANGSQIAYNDNWAPAIAPLTASVGAFSLPPGSADAAMSADLGAGNYTAVVAGGPGAAMVELYDSGPDSALQVRNLSTRGYVTAASPLEAGLVIKGSGTKRVLLRAVGPGLTSFGIANPLINLSIKLVIVGFENRPIFSNTGWSSSPLASQLALSAAAAGAFPLTAGSADSAILADLPAGEYTIVMAKNGGSDGVGLIEVYIIDQ